MPHSCRALCGKNGDFRQCEVEVVGWGCDNPVSVQVPVAEGRPIITGERVSPTEPAAPPLRLLQEPALSEVEGVGNDAAESFGFTARTFRLYWCTAGKRRQSEPPKKKIQAPTRL